MKTLDTYSFLADLVLLFHTLFIAFVIGGFFLILAGLKFKRPWVENFWFRTGHLSAIIIVTIKPLTNRLCPLTIWESRLREAAGGKAYLGGFIQHWIHKIIYYDLPLWFFSIIYILFALIVIFVYIAAPPVWPLFLRQKSLENKTK